MIIRQATVEDTVNLISLSKKGNDMHYDVRPDKFNKRNDEDYYKMIYATIERGYNPYLVAIIDDKFVGYMEYTILDRKDKVAYIDQFYVDEEYRKKGVGKALMNELEKIAKDIKCDKIELNCWSFNENALDFYYHLGYKNQRVILEKEIRNDN